MGKNTSERQKFIIENLRVETDTVDDLPAPAAQPATAPRQLDLIPQ